VLQAEYRPDALERTQRRPRDTLANGLRVHGVRGSMNAGNPRSRYRRVAEVL
jgi:hypothetical protein